MSLIARVKSWLRASSSRSRLEREMDEALVFHLERYTQELIRRGVSPQEAARRARIELGGIATQKEQMRASLGLRLWDDLRADLRYGVRMLAKSPGFASIAILTMALGIGATTAIFSVIDATLLHPLSCPHPEQLVRIEDDLPGAGAQDVGMSVPEWKDLQRFGIFEYVSPIGGGSVNLTGVSQPERIFFLNVAPNYPALLGVKPELGHWFDPEDKTPGFTLEVLISDGLWKRDFGGDPHILGRNLRLDNDLYHVIGVMPPSFHDPLQTTEQRNTELWAASGWSAAPAPLPQRNSRVLTEAIARLKPGLTIAAAQSELDALVASLQKQFPGDYPLPSAWRMRLVPLKESVVGNVRQSLLLLLSAVALVLLIGCVNVANLLLARASTREREMGVRQALGASRTRLTRQLLTESLLLSFFGSVAGLAILFCAKGPLLAMIPESLPRLSDISMNWTVLLFALGISVVAGVVFGLAPARRTSRLDLTPALRQEGRGSTASTEQARTRRVLVIIEFALSLMIMIAAGLLLRSFWDLYKVQLGFNPQHVMAVRTWLPIPNDPATDPYRTPAQEAPLLRELLRRGRALPGVEESAIGSLASLPLGHGKNDLNRRPLIREGHEVPTDEAPLINVSVVTPGYFHLLGISLLRGSLFSDLNNEQTPEVGVINEAMAQTYWPNEDPLGKRIKVRPARPTWITVVGIVANARTESVTEANIPQIYLSMYQLPAKDLAIFLRGSPDPSAIAGEVREQVQAVDPQLPVFGAETLDDALSASLAERRFSMEMIGLFALTGLLLAALGIYGTMSYMVSERLHEIGIRLALGAQRTTILEMVLRQGLVLATTGAAVGALGSLIASHLMAGLLYGIRPTDPLTFVSVAILLIGIALLACYIPAWRAMHVNPVRALRHE